LLAVGSSVPCPNLRPKRLFCQVYYYPDSS
jgi:hypothetical protein